MLAEQYVLAVDIGGTKVVIAGIDLKGQIFARKKEPTCQSGPSDGVKQIIRMLHEVLSESERSLENCLGIGIGIPAVLEPETDFVIWGPNLNGWKDVNLSNPLIDEFNVPVAIEYDGHAAALGELWMGRGKHFNSFVDVIIGTGIGGGVIIDGNLVRGKNRLAGAVGWFVLTGDDIGDSSRSSNLGFWEEKIAGPGIAQNAQSLLSQYPDSVLHQENLSNNLDAQAVFNAFSMNDPLAIKVLDNLAVSLGRGLANIVSLLNPDAIILGGGVGAHCKQLLPRIKNEINRWAQPISTESFELSVSSLGPDAGLLGAAYGVLLRIKKYS